MQISVSLSLPRDSMSVPVVRRVTIQSLHALGVHDDDIADIELALSEACTNVLLHADDSDEYTVSASVDGRCCVIEVVDAGRGLDAGQLSTTSTAALTAEQGRGLQIMRALMDKLTLDAADRAGTIVHMEKELRWDPDAPVMRLADGQRPATARPATG